MSLENNQIEKLVHEFKDNYTLDGSEMIKAFLELMVFSWSFFKIYFSILLTITNLMFLEKSHFYGEVVDDRTKTAKAQICPEET